MSGADLFEDGFPHSTKEGYRAGCRGRACPGVAENGISCAEAYSRYQGDYGFKKKVDAGMSAAEIVSDEKAVPVVGKPRPVKKPTVKPLSEEAVAAVVAAEVVLAEVEPPAEPESEPAGKDVEYEKHGTPKGYFNGCRLKDACPGIQRVGKSCNAAVNEYQRELKATRAKRAGEKSAEPKQPAHEAAIEQEEPVEAELPVDVVRLDQAHQLVGVDADGELCSCGRLERTLVEHLGGVALNAEPTVEQDDELLRLRARVTELEQLLKDATTASEAAPVAAPAVATLVDGSKLTVVVTLERAA